MLDWLIALDGNILLWIQDVVRNGILDSIFSVYTKLGDVGLMWIVLSLVMLCFPKTRKAGIMGILALLVGTLCTNVVLKHLVGRARPWLTVEGLNFLVVEHDPNSFPSGHTCAAFAAAAGWYAYLPKKWMGVMGLILAALMGLSRLYVGVHFPSDVLVGALVGVFSAWLVCFAYQKLAARREVKP